MQIDEHGNADDGTPVPVSAPSPGWYADPHHRFADRYWTGNEWTARVRNGAAEGTDPLGIAASPVTEPTPVSQPSYAPPAPPPPAAYPAGVYQGQPYGGAPRLPTVSGFAVASLVLGILWIYWIGAILALVFGYVALAQIKRENGWKTGRGMAIAGVVLGWIGIAVLALIIVAAALGAGSSSGGNINTDSSNGVCDDSRFMQDPDC